MSRRAGNAKCWGGVEAELISMADPGAKGFSPNTGLEEVQMGSGGDRRADIVFFFFVKEGSRGYQGLSFMAGEGGGAAFHKGTVVTPKRSITIGIP